MGMLKHTESAEDIGDRAYKEHHIEVSLKKMQEMWIGQDFKLPPFKHTGTSYISGFEDAI